MRRCERNNVINYPFIDYIIKSYVPDLKFDQRSHKVNMDTFMEAMLHSSTKYEPEQKTYERLEYLGDAIFHMIITEYLFKRYDDDAEGFLTKLRIRIERGDSMAELAKILNLDYFIQIDKIGINDHILEDVFEAFIGAFYLNFKMTYTRMFIIQLIERHKDLSELISNDDNFKDILLRYFHQKKWGHPIYEEDNNNNSNKFVSIVKNPINNKQIGMGVASSKKKAEQIASKKALITLNVIVDGEIDQNWLQKMDKIDKEDKDKSKKDGKSMSVFNPNNKLMKKSDIQKITKAYGVVVPSNININTKIFYEAMTHRSYLTRKTLTSDDKEAAKSAVKLQKKSNERLQFLGDSVIHFVIGEFLYHKYPDQAEGFLTRLRCKLENRESLYYLAIQTDISSYVLISQNIEVLHGRTNINIIGGGFEAFIGALYLELGLNLTREFILAVIRTELDIGEIAENETNYKDLVLQLYNKNHWGHPIYKILKEEGPDHAKTFTMGIYLGDKLMGQGKASSKKKAEQIASKVMLENYVKNQDKII